MILTLCINIQAKEAKEKGKVRDAMKKATEYLYNNVANNGGFVWTYSEDLTERWGELEAYPSMVWIEKSTCDVGNLMIDAYHATQDEYYYERAMETARVLIRGQLPCGGWNYKFDLAGPASEMKWYSTIGKNAWGMGEHNVYYGNATFDDDVTSGTLNFLIRLYVEKYDPILKPAIDKGVEMIYSSQFPSGGWPQRWPLMYTHPREDGSPDYSACLTLNDDVHINNIELLMRIYFLLGDARAKDAIERAMTCLCALQQGMPSCGWAEQYYEDFSPAAAREFEPACISTSRTCKTAMQMLLFYELTGDTRYLSGIQNAIDFIRKVKLDDNVAAELGWKIPEGNVFCPRFIKPGTLEPLYLHRKGTHVNNGCYYIDNNYRNTIRHYKSIGTVNVSELESEYERVKALDRDSLIANSLFSGNYFYGYDYYHTAGIASSAKKTAEDVVKSLDSEGRWISLLSWVLMPYVGDGNPDDVAPDVYEETEHGRFNTAAIDNTREVYGIAIKEYVKNMSVLIKYLVR